MAGTSSSLSQFTAQLTLSPDSSIKPKISGTALNGDVYQFLQLHFHWHFEDDKGTEHAVDGRRYSLEVTFKSSKVSTSTLCTFSTRKRQTCTRRSIYLKLEFAKPVAQRQPSFFDSMHVTFLKFANSMQISLTSPCSRRSPSICTPRFIAKRRKNQITFLLLRQWMREGCSWQSTFLSSLLCSI